MPRKKKLIRQSSTTNIKDRDYSNDPLIVKKKKLAIAMLEESGFPKEWEKE